MRTGPLAVAGWVVAATLTLGVSWSAMQGIRTAVAPADLDVSAADSLPVPTETSTAAPTSAPTSASPRPSASPTAGTVTQVGVGGTIRVSCAGGVPRVVGAIPRQGFSVDVDDSPGEVKFTSGSHRTEMNASCAGGRPQVRVEEDDRGDGGDDDSGRGGGNSGRGGGDDG